MLYADPVTTDYASGHYYDTAGAEYYLSPTKLEADYAPVRFERELRRFRRHCERGAVLDVGCGSGGFLYHLSQRFPGVYEVMGTDASGPALDYAASRGISVVRGDFPQQDFGERTFDAVTFWAVLEHLLEPKAFVEKASLLLRPGGLCFVLVPNMRSLAARLLGARYRYVYPQHLNYFTRETLSQLGAARFEPVELGSSHFNPVVIWQDWRRRGGNVSNEERGELLKRTTAYKQNPWLKPVKAAYGLTEKALGALTLADNLVAVWRKKA
jgi:SAM-dependent methyltransferase